MNKLDKKQKAAIKYRMIAVLSGQIDDRVKELLEKDLKAGSKVSINISCNINIGKDIKEGEYLEFTLGAKNVK